MSTPFTAIRVRSGTHGFPVCAAVAAACAAWVVPGLPDAVRASGGALLLLVAPGLALYLCTERRLSDPLEGALAGLVFSPLVVALAAVVGILLGADGLRIGQVVMAISAGLVVALTLRTPTVPPRAGRRELVILVALAVTVLLLCAWLPFTREWWRVRSDAWFHAAVVAEIRDTGLPPGDPYFLGMPLQYMWFYHALVLTLESTLRVDAFWAMAIVNVSALAALVAAAWHLAAVFRASAAHRLWATATLLFAFNAAFWVLLPLKLGKAMIGEVRGLEEVGRTFQLTPLHYDRAYGFMNIYYNQEFFLDKFMVATAFGLALVFLLTAWYAACEYLRQRRAWYLVALAASIIGMLGFHSLVGFVTLAGLFGGAILMHLSRAHVEGYRARRSVHVLAVSLLCFLAMTPYLYAVMHMKERSQVFPLSVSFEKTAGIIISSALVLVLALRQPRFWADRAPWARLFALGAASVSAFCLLITLPGPNTYDKLGYFAFLPLSIIGGFTLADRVAARRGRGARRTALAWVLLFFLPVNAIAFVSCFGTPDGVDVTDEEAAVSAWVRTNTARDAVFFDDHDRTFLLVTGPRRYLWGNYGYAMQWGYPRLEMSRRFHARNALYSAQALDATTLALLGEVGPPLYVVVRPEHRADAIVMRDSDGFERVYDDGNMALVRVDADRCRARAATARGEISSEELIRESGL